MPKFINKVNKMAMKASFNGQYEQRCCKNCFKVHFGTWMLLKNLQISPLIQLVLIQFMQVCLYFTLNCINKHSGRSHMSFVQSELSQS